jgi:hypothetical protein
MTNRPMIYWCRIHKAPYAAYDACEAAPATSERCDFVEMLLVPKDKIIDEYTTKYRHPRTYDEDESRPMVKVLIVEDTDDRADNQ